MPKSKEQCLEIREKMRNAILQKATLYFARNGFAGTKISDLSRDIGIAPGTIYVYFESKEELFHEILKITNYGKELDEMALLTKLPIPAKDKLLKLSKYIMENIAKEKMYAAKIALNTTIMMEQSISFQDTMSQSKLYELTETIILQGQKEGSTVNRPAKSLADYYWSVVYVYAMKRLFTAGYEPIAPEDLCRTVLIQAPEK